MVGNLQRAMLLIGGILIAAMAGAEQRIDVGAEYFGSNDVGLSQGNANWRWERPDRGLIGEVSVAFNRFNLDYQPVPFDFRGASSELTEISRALQTNLRWRTREDWQWIGSAGVYDGYTNYRSIWLAEYFRQQFEPLGATAPDSYVRPDPKGVSAGAGFRWEYVPASGFLELVVTGLRDEVAPGYEIDFDGLRRGRERLNGLGISVSTENVLSSRVRSRVQVSATRVSERNWRISGEGAVNVALAENLVGRLSMGGATEDPQFGAWYGQAVVDWELSERWALFASGRYYVDTGEIEDALLFTSAAPGVISRRIEAGLRWAGASTSIRLAAGRMRSDYEPTNPRTDFFQNLYQDRNWTVVQLTLTRGF